MNINEVYGGSFLKAVDLQGRAVQATISAVTLEKFDDEQKLAIHFQGKDKVLICNKTNAAMIAATFTDETDHWIGKTIELHSEKVSFSGRIVDAIRVRAPAQPVPPVQTAAVPAPAEQPAPTECAPLEGDIPW